MPGYHVRLFSSEPIRQRHSLTKSLSFLHDHSYFAVAQKKYVFIYDRDGVELHRLKSHIEPTRLEYLPYHWLLASIASDIFFLRFN